MTQSEPGHCTPGSRCQMTLGSSLTAWLISRLFPAVVCYQANRDELRHRIIQWLEAEIIPDGWFSKGSNYSEILDKYFKVISVAVSSGPEKGKLPSPIVCLGGNMQLLRVPGCFHVVKHPTKLWSCPVTPWINRSPAVNLWDPAHTCCPL